MSMAIAEIVAYTLLVTAGVALLYSVLIVVEMKKGIRVGKRVRGYMDKKVAAVQRRLKKDVDFVNTLYERGVDEVEKDLIDPVAKPIIETQHRYTKLKTGEREIVYTGKRGVSPHLKKIVELHKKSKKKKRQAQKRRKRKRERQDADVALQAKREVGVVSQTKYEADSASQAGSEENPDND